MSCCDMKARRCEIGRKEEQGKVSRWPSGDRMKTKKGGARGGAVVHSGVLLEPWVTVCGGGDGTSPAPADAGSQAVGAAAFASHWFLRLPRLPLLATRTQPSDGGISGSSGVLTGGALDMRFGAALAVRRPVPLGTGATPFLCNTFSFLLASRAVSTEGGRTTPLA